jgi:hypothetical protein
MKTLAHALVPLAWLVQLETLKELLVLLAWPVWLKLLACKLVQNMMLGKGPVQLKTLLCNALQMKSLGRLEHGVLANARLMKKSLACTLVSTILANVLVRQKIPVHVIV